MKLYLVRHGHAVSAVEDPARPLSDAGRDDVARTASKIRANGAKPTAVYHSGLARARETAEIIAGNGEDGWPVEERAGLAPDDAVAPVLAGYPGDGDVMLVGHLPFMGRLAALAISGDESGDVVEFDAGAVACLETTGAGWRLAWFYSPVAAR